MKVRFCQLDFFSYFCRIIMKKFNYFTIFVLLVALPLLSSAQDRPNVRQNKEKPKISATNQGIKVNKLVKTTDPYDEYAKVEAETYDKKPKKDAKKEAKKQDASTEKSK